MLVSQSQTVISVLICKIRVEDSRHLFDEIPDRSVVSWTSIIAGCVQNDRARDAVRVFKELLVEESGSVESEDGVFVDSVLLGCVVSASIAVDTLVCKLADEIAFWMLIMAGKMYGATS